MTNLYKYKKDLEALIDNEVRLQIGLFEELEMLSNKKEKEQRCLPFFMMTRFAA